MNLADLLLIVALVLVVILAVFFSVRRKKQGKGCCGDCEACRGCDTMGNRD